jgi:hypothetical protein
MRTWNRFWFAESPATNLAAARIIIGVHALWILLSRDFAGVAALPPEFWDGVSTAARWRYLLFPGHAGVEQVLYIAAAIALAAVIAGWRPRVTCAISALLLYHLAPLETIIWTSNPYERGLEISVIALLVLAAAPCADAWSLQARPASGAGAWSADYRWPLVAIQLVIAQIYLFSGYAKLYRVGPEWISAENMARWLQVFNQQDQVAVFQGPGAWLAQYPAATLTIAVAAIALDLGFIAVLFWRKARAWLLPAALCFHLGILICMNIAFLNAPQLLVFLNWDGIRQRLARGHRQ